MVKMAVLGVEGTWGLLSAPEKGFLGEMSFGAVRSQFKCFIETLKHSMGCARFCDRCS